MFQAAAATNNNNKGPPAPAIPSQSRNNSRSTSGGTRNSGGGGGGGRGGGAGNNNPNNNRRSGSVGGGGRGGGGGGGGRGGGRGINYNNSGTGGGRGSAGGGGGGGRGNASFSNNPSGRGNTGRGGSNKSGRGTGPNPRRDNQSSQQQQKQLQSTDQQQQQPEEETVVRTNWDEIVLWNSMGMGTTEAEKSVIRRSVVTFMSCRMDYMDEPPVLVPGKGEEEGKIVEDDNGVFHWTPFPHCIWSKHDNNMNNNSGAVLDREAYWKQDMNSLWNYKPIEIDHETRWKKQEDDEGETMRRAVGILNKLSWTTIDKLTISFLGVIGLGSLLIADDAKSSTNNSKDGTPVAKTVDMKLIQDTMALVLDKAMSEPHFAELYAHFASRLANVNKQFRRTLLALCEAQFENTDNTTGNETATGASETNPKQGEEEQEEESSQNIDKEQKSVNKDGEDAKTLESSDKEVDAADAEYKASIAKKKYLGLMQFIGELYKLNMIRPKIVVYCLQQLFVKDDEEKLECFVKLMTTIGEGLDKEDSIRDQLEHIWDDVYSMAGLRKTTGENVTVEGPKAPSNRIKFLLQDLSELRDGGWVESQRQQDAKAKTIAQIHKEVAMEEQGRPQQPNRPGGAGGMALSKNKMTRSQSAGISLSSSRSFGSDNNSSAAAGAATSVDSDGFQRIQNTKMPKKGSGLRRAQSDVVNPKTNASNSNKSQPTSSLERALAASTSADSKDTSQPSGDLPGMEQSAKEYPSPEECRKKMQNILKEYFVGGDTADAVLSLSELVGATALDFPNDDSDSVKRGVAVVEGGISLVLEGKESDVAKFLTIIRECVIVGQDQQAQTTILPRQCFNLALIETLEFLWDIEIDAPRAPAHLAEIIADWMCLPLPTKEDGSSSSVLILDVAHLLLKQAPDIFRDSGHPAEFAKQVLQLYHGKKVATCSDGDVDKVITEDLVDMVSQLMSEEERSQNANVREWITSSF